MWLARDLHAHSHTAYPRAGLPYYNTYGPGLSSASKFYSFGYLETLPLQPQEPQAVVPLQGTALFVVGLKGEEDAALR